MQKFNPSHSNFLMDHGNILLFHLSLFLKNHLQQMQNYATCLVTCAQKGEHITPVCSSCTGFLLFFRSLYYLLSHTFEVLIEYHYISKWSEQNVYISETCRVFKVPKATQQLMYREKSFWASAPRLWNKFPNNVKFMASKEIFCKVLKTYLFK